MPWNDASDGVTNLQSWQAQDAATGGWVGIDAEAHYSRAGQRLRFLGVNIGAEDAFPSHANAEAHAARLARFGFNAVRMHHLEAPWSKDRVLVDYPAGNSRGLSAERLERLQYFVAKLAEKGIHTNLNLLVSREFQPGDGLGTEISQLGWKDQQVLGLFLDDMVVLQKEYASKLLGAPNPYRNGLRFADDPAVSFVEIMNENGFLQKWHEGVVDKLPASYALKLEQKWNAWLKQKYPGGTAAMLAAWGAVDQPYGPEKLLNADFSSALDSWALEQHSGAVAAASVGANFNGKPALSIQVTTAGTAGWHVQFRQNGLSLQEGKIYTLRFWARSAQSSNLTAAISRAYGDYGTVAPSLDISTTDTWTSHSLSFQSGVTDAQLRLVFNGFGGRTGTVQLADVHLTEGGRLGGIPEGTSLEQGNVPIVKRTATGLAPTFSQRSDFFRYMLDAERVYWTTMRDHIKIALGYKGIVWGTILSNSPANAQAMLDAMDSHTYWEHPTWPAGKDWDPVLWSMPNTSMVNNPSGSTLATIGRQRVAGYPHNVTEYQHASPNSYSSEGPLLSAAYGALQDWDSLWYFSYLTGSSEYTTGFFDHGGHPGKMANNLIAACLFRRGDVSVARRDYTAAFSPQTELQVALAQGGAWSVADGTHLGMPGTLTLVSRLALDIGEQAAGLTQMPAAPSGGLLEADTGELVWDTRLAGKGLVTINSPKTKALVGFVSQQDYKLGEITVTPGQTRLGWCTLALSLTEGRSFNHAGGGRALLVATGEISNTGMQWKDSTHTSLGDKWGGAPTLVEPIPGTISLPVGAERVKVWVLNGSGQRGTSLAVSQLNGRAQFQLGNAETSLWYEIEISPAAPVAPEVTREPQARVAALGATVRFDLEYDGYPEPSIQWYHKGVAIPGATSRELSLPSVSLANLGRYQAVLINSAGEVRSREALLAIQGHFEGQASRLSNISTRAEVRSGDQVMVSGFVLEGGRSLLVRGVGPKLGSFGVPGVLPDPMLQLYRAGTQTPFLENDTWNPAETQALSDKVGAFSIAGSPKEAVLHSQLSSGGYSCILRGSAGETGIALIEAYDTGIGEGRLKNISTRALAGTQNESLIVGFSISGDQPKKVLIRAAGPALAAFGISDCVQDPVLKLYEMKDGKALFITRNDDWEDHGSRVEAVAAFDQSGAFGLVQGSRDAALVLWLEPGNYSALMEAKQAKAVGIVEVYELQ